MSFTPHMKRQAELLAGLSRQELNGYSVGTAANKEAYLKIGRSVLRAMAKHYQFTNGKVSVNPAGVAVSGDITLIGMFDDSRGIYICMSSPMLFGGTPEFYYRSVRHIKDYTGGVNHRMTYDELASDLSFACTRMKRIVA